MSYILFRCDASLTIGSGHVIRCRTLARELKRRGKEIVFICRRQPGDLIHLLEQEFRVLELPEQPLVASTELEGRELYTAWLGCTQEQDAADCIEAQTKAGITKASWLVVDHYGIDATWQKSMITGLTDGELSTKLLVIDDLADRNHIADILLDQNFFGERTSQRYKQLLPRHCLQLLGPHYALLAPEYSQLHPLVTTRTELRRVMVFFGGVDPDNYTGLAVEALMDPALAHLEVDVVLGSQSQQRQAIEELVSRRPGTTLHYSLPSLAFLIVRADLAIGAGGTTTWERACLGLPSIVVALAANQLTFAKALHQEGHIRLLGADGRVTAEQIRSALLDQVVKPCTGEECSKLTDGWGASRIAIALLGVQSMSLRQYKESDRSLLKRWTNHSKLDYVEFLQEPTSPTDNDQGCQQRLISAKQRWFIAIEKDGCPIGQVIFNAQSDNNKNGVKEATVNLTLDNCANGHRQAEELVHLSMEALESSLGSPNLAYFARKEFTKKPDCASIIPSPVSFNQSQSLGQSRITILTDKGSWFNAYIPKLIIALWERGHTIRWIHNPSQLAQGDVCLLLSCGRLLSAKQLGMNRHNLVVHASDLPKGQGWSPMTWQILEGASSIPLTLFEAAEALDAGPIYLQKQIELAGHELLKEWQELQAKMCLELCLDWFDGYVEVVNSAQTQSGEPSNYGRRRPADSKLDPYRSLADQFNLLRTVDNKRYPAFFQLKNQIFQIKVTNRRSINEE